jgi:hypothetical protein
MHRWMGWLAALLLTLQAADAAPLGLPLKQRADFFRKGNLAPNPSFEEPGPPPAGRGTPRGWTCVGRNVERLARPEEAGGAAGGASGGHAVRIARSRAGETDAAEGVLSDYIPVIAGNYEFTYAVKLENIVGPHLRAGGRLKDAVCVQLRCFDAERRPLDARLPDPVGGGLIDASDKSYAFANHWRIDDFPWGRVAARTYHYPFAEGELPAKTRYVRLFLGLKGRGVMWIDEIDFRYSKWNFTPLERMAPLFEAPLSPAERLIPAPRSIAVNGEIPLLDPADPAGPAPAILLPAEPHPAERAAARLLQETLDAVLRRAAGGGEPAARTRVIHGAAALDPAPRLLFAVGAARLPPGLEGVPPPAEPPPHPEGYVIESRALAGGARAVFLRGAAPAGSFHAAATAAQLVEPGRPVYHDAAVRDWPDFDGRAFVFPTWKDAGELSAHLAHLPRLAAWKLNKVYVGFQGRTPDWQHPGAEFRRGVAAIGAACAATGVLEPAFMVNPYAHFTFMPAASGLTEAARNTWTHSDPQSFAALTEVIGIGLDAGASAVMLQSDDFVPHAGRNPLNFSLYTEADRRRFVNLQNAQADLIGRLARFLAARRPGVRLEFCPPYYNNEFIDRSEGWGEAYLRDLAAQIPAEVAVIWTGPTVRSLAIDAADLHRFGSLIGRPPMTWDNTLYARGLESRAYGGFPTHYPELVRRCNLFEPFDGPRPADFHRRNDGGHMYVNGAVGSETMRIKIATVADYEWNTAAYDPERSLWKALVQLGGAGCAAELLRFNDAYYRLLEVCLRGERGALGKGERAAGERFSGRMQRALDAAAARLGADHGLVAELAALAGGLRQRLEKLPAGGRRR